MAYNKYYVYKEAVSYDSGVTWSYTGNETPSGSVIATYDTLSECESSYTGGTKLFATYSDGRQRLVDCVGNGLTEADIKPSGYEFSAMTSAVIGDCVTSIGRLAFYNRYGISLNLTSVTIPNSVTSIGWEAFGWCNSLTAITIPSGVTNIEGYTFADCISLKRVNSSVDGVCNIPNSITSIDNWAFSHCTSLTSITIPNSVTSISRNVFNGCSGLTSVNIPNSITNIGICAFRFCRSLPSVTIPDSVISIGWAAFDSCSSLTSANIPSGVTSISEDVFRSCSSLTAITIPSGVTSIDTYAFMDCSSLTSITCLATTPPTLGRDVFYNTNSCPIYVPSGSVSAYKSASGWSTYASRIQPIP